jgi:aminopeptidase N
MLRMLALAAAVWLNPESSAMQAQAEPDAPGAGVPLALAEERARRVTGLAYDLRFTIPAAQAEPINGRAIIRFNLADATRGLALDFEQPQASVVRLQAGGRDVAPRIVNGHLMLAAGDLRAGANEVTIDFVAGNAPLNRNPEFLYTIFVPARARQAFPCFDQPDLKGTYAVTLEIPEGWEGITNGALLDRQPVEGRVRLRFAQTKPIPTYLFAFAAGKFSVETAERKGRTFRMLHRETDAEKVARNRGAIFDLHAAALDWLERYTTIPYPFGKFDFVLVPSFQFGGMEHPGSIFYNASGLLLDPSATQNQMLGRASVIAHETAHMWFGDLVTMKWFNDVWMKEVFANFMAAKIVNPSFPEINHDLRFLFAHYPSAYDVDRTAGTNAIRQHLDNLNEAGSLYGAIIYQKAPIVMRQLEMIMGEEVFRDGLREYLKAHPFGNATWADLIALLDKRTPRDLTAWSRAWVEEPGRPIISTTGVDGGRGIRLSFDQKDPSSPKGAIWSQPLSISIGQPDGIEHVTVDGGAGGFGVVHARPDSATAPDSILYVLPNGKGIGYGDFVLDPASRTYLTAHLADVTDALTRGSALVALWEEMLGGRVPPATIVDMLAASLPRESDELNVQRMLSCLEQAFWKFLAADDRDGRAPAIERMLRAGLDAAKTSSLKSAWFNALRDMARTRDTLAWLERVWRKTENVPGLVLAEPDYITLALELAVREVPAWKAILDDQFTRIENPDRKARFAFVRPALSADLAERDAFFAQLNDVANRRREPWVLEGLAYMHHPLRAASAEKHIATSLAMLREIQRTGDIFFPKRWMDATLAGHRAPSAARVVRRFVDELPADYPDRLRRIILSSADDLFRVSATTRQ